MKRTQALFTAALPGSSLSSCRAFIQACFTERVFTQVRSDCHHNMTSMLANTAVALCMKLCATVHVYIVLAAKIDHSDFGLTIKIEAVPKLISISILMQMVAETAPLSGFFNVHPNSDASAVRAPLSVFHAG